MNFFFDRNISHVLVKMIDVFDRDNTVRHHRRPILSQD